MPKNQSKIIAEQLGMSNGKAHHKLRQEILFSYIKLVGHNICYECKTIIENVNEFSIEHKEPWQGRDSDLFWDLDNIAFSHRKCNRPHKYGNGRSGDSHDHLRKEIINGKAQCCACKKWIDIAEFSKNKNRFNGLSSRCIDCRKKLPSRKINYNHPNQF